MAAPWNAFQDLLCEPLAGVAEQSRREAFDAVVVGGGTAGIVAALTLIERGLRVALLEAGPVALTTHAQGVDARFQPGAYGRLRAPIEYAPEHVQSGRDFGLLVGCLGGRGLFWQGSSPRMREHELAGWPLPLAELVPHYEWVESQLGVSTRYGESGLSAVILRELRRNGLPFEACPFAVDTHATANGWLGGTVGNPMSILLRRGVFTPDRRNPAVAVHAFASRILLRDGDSQAAGVLATDRGSRTAYEILGRRVILAAGALESVRLAAVSGVPDPGGLIGTGIVEHLFVRGHATLPAGWYDPGRPEVALGILPSTADRNHQVEVHAPSGLIFAAGPGTRWSPGPADPDYRAMVRSFGAMQVQRANHVEPLPEERPGSYRVHLEHGPQDKATLDAMLDIVQTVQGLIGEPSAPPEIRPFGASYHEAGGLAMGSAPAQSVTDGAGRLWGCSNVTVCDAAAWPSIGAANVHLSIAALSRRNAHLAVDA